MPLRLVMPRFPCNRIKRLTRNQNHNAKRNAHDRPADRYCDQGRQDHHLHHPSRTRRAVSGHHLLHGRAGDPRGTARHGAAARHVRLLRDAAQHVLPLRRHGARADPAGSGSARAQADVRLHELHQHSHGDGRHQGPARLRRDAGSREHENRRHRRLLHERPLRGQRGDAFSGSREGGGFDLRHASGDRPARQPASGRERRPRPNSISPAPRPTSMRRRRLSTRSRPA